MVHTNHHTEPIILIGFSADSELARAMHGSGRRVVDLLEPGDLSAAALVIDAGAGDAETAGNRLQRIAELVGTDVPIASASTAAPVTELAAGAAGPGRVIGLHLHDTGPGRGTIEIVPGLETEQRVVQYLMELVDAIADVTGVVTKDRPGRLLDALFVPYLNDVIRELDDGLATAEDLDVALQLGLGYQRGPMELLDSMGLDRHLENTQALHAATGDPRYVPPALLRQMVAAGHLGTTSGRGFRATSAPTQ